MPEHRENKWASHFIYGTEINFNLGTATKVNMILYGDGSTNIFVKDGLLPFRMYDKETAPNALKQYDQDQTYFDKEVNGQFDLIITNPPFSVDLDNETKKNVKKEFIFGDKKNSENLFIERYYQLLRENGRMGIVLPESVFDTTENKYIRLFIYKYFKVKAVVSLPQLTFEPFTSTKTSLLFAQKKTKAEIEEWNKLWSKYSNEWNNLKTRCENLSKVYLDKKDRKKLPSIKDLTEKEEKEILARMLKDYIDLPANQIPKIENNKYITYVLECEDGSLYKGFTSNLEKRWNEHLFGNGAEHTKKHKPVRLAYYEVFDSQHEAIEREKYFKTGRGREFLEKNIVRQAGEGDQELSSKEIVKKYKDELKELCKYDNDTKEIFGFVNTWWVFGEVAKELNYKIFMAEVENVGYKRTKRGEKPMPNELYRVNEKGEVLVDDGLKETALDHLREVKWD